MGTTEHLDFNKLIQYYFQRTSMGNTAVDLRVPPGGDGSANGNSYVMPANGRVMAFTLHLYGGNLSSLSVNDTWRIRKYTDGAGETTLDTVVSRSGLNNPTGTNYNITVRLQTPFEVKENEILLIKRQVSGGNIYHAVAYLYVDFDDSTKAL